MKPTGSIARALATFLHSLGQKRASGNCNRITGNQSDLRNVSGPAASLKAVHIPVGVGLPAIRPMRSGIH